MILQTSTAFFSSYFVTIFLSLLKTLVTPDFLKPDRAAPSWDRSRFPIKGFFLLLKNMKYSLSMAARRLQAGGSGSRKKTRTKKNGIEHKDHTGSDHIKAAYFLLLTSNNFRKEKRSCHIIIIIFLKIYIEKLL